MGYYPHWVSNQMAISSVDFSVVTHVNHAFAWPDQNGNILSYDNMFSSEVCETVQENGSKILLSLGGWGNDVGFRTIAESQELRSIFINNLLEILDTYGYNGLIWIGSTLLLMMTVKI